jgi:hypothetical protein
MSDHFEKIDLLQDQIDNLEKSGFFTEAEMDKLTHPLRMERDALTNNLFHPEHNTDNTFIIPSTKFSIYKG